MDALPSPVCAGWMFAVCFYLLSVLKKEKKRRKIKKIFKRKKFKKEYVQEKKSP